MSLSIYFKLRVKLQLLQQPLFKNLLLLISCKLLLLLFIFFVREKNKC